MYFIEHLARTNGLLPHSANRLYLRIKLCFGSLVLQDTRSQVLAVAAYSGATCLATNASGRAADGPSIERRAKAGERRGRGEDLPVGGVVVGCGRWLVPADGRPKTPWVNTEWVAAA